MAWRLLKRGTLLKNDVAYFGILNKTINYEKCYQVLEIDQGSDQEQIRSAYLALVKRYHPDSGTDEASAEKFQEIDRAFRVLTTGKSQEKSAVEEVVHRENGPDIKRAAPQHRPYLSYEGIGAGNIFQRHKQHAEAKAIKAAENVYEHRVAKSQADETQEKVPLKRRMKTPGGLDLLVENLIQQSMLKGEFKNLKGFGKPLPAHQNENPYVDFVTHKVNEILIDNGFAPEWITLQKEIRREARQLRENLLMEREHFGPCPLGEEESIEWSDKVDKYSKVVDQINKKITKFNLVVPVLNKQILHISLQNEAQQAIVNGKTSEDVGRDSQRKKDSDKKYERVFSFINHFFKRT